MRDLPTFASGTLATSTAEVAHLFELELAKVRVMAAVASGSTYVVVDDIDKCFIGQKLVYLPPLEAINAPKFVEVSAISLILNMVTLTTATESTISEGAYLYETLYDEVEYPQLAISGSDYIYKLQLWHSAFGTLSGRMLFTDYDVPIVATLSDGVFSPYDNYAVYIPWPINYSGTSFDTQGRMSNVEITVGNVDQRFSNIILTHEALRRRKIKIYTVYLSSATEINLNVPISVNANVTVVAGMVDNLGNPEESLNSPFNSAVYDAADSKIQEFEGLVDNLSMDQDAVTITALNYIDTADAIMLPRNLYTRGRCQFVYKGPKCRFVPTLTLYATATASDTTICVIDTEGKFPLVEMKVDETHIVQVGQEQMLVTAVASATSTKFLTQETHHKTAMADIYAKITATPETFAYKLTVTREYNSTSAATHEPDTLVDMILCRKTFHDCRLHFHERMFGGFPAIPKQIYNV